uniref:RNA-directed RNA polymerase L n=1 Tax=Anourosorex squamipes rhabdovirus TaxID=3139458 RepID=A0AB38ZJM5_9RHAB
MIANLISERYCLLISGLLGDYFNLKNYLKYEQLLRIFQWGDELIRLFYSNAYNIIRHFEPLVLGGLLSEYHDEYCDNQKFLGAIIEDIQEETEKTWIRNQSDKNRILEIVDLLLTNVVSVNIHQKCQTFGLYRIWGHPSINIINGIKKVKRLATYEKLIDNRYLSIIRNKFKEMFFFNYRRKNGVWPNHYVEPGSSNYLVDCLNANKMINKNNKFYDLELWEDVEFEKTMEVDSKFNLSTILADKAVSPNKQAVINSYKKGKMPSFLSRRVIMAWLQSNYTDAEEFLTQIDDDGFVSDDLIIGVCPKEREMKIDPRLFAVMSLKLRLYFVLTESMLADYVLPLFPQITMIDDVLKLSKKIYNATKEMSGKNENEAIIITNIDFEKWNSNMRGELANSIFSQLDQIFGFKQIYTRTHQIFKESTIYLTDGTLEIIPEEDDLQDGPGVWRNHLGGFEGLRQKGWTLLTVVILEYVAQNYPINHTILGQGDNQVIICKIRSRFNRSETPELFRNDVQNIHKSFLDDLCDFLDKLGLPLKLRETWVSSLMFMYGKEMYFKGMPLSMSQKRLARMFPLANEMYPSLENALSTIYCNGNSAAMADLTPIIPFLVSVIQGSDCIYSHLDYSPIIGTGLMELCLASNAKWSVQLRSQKIPRGFDNHQMEIVTQYKNLIPYGLLYMPKILGGYPIQCLLDFTNRGFPDPLVQSLSLLMSVYYKGKIKNSEKRVLEGILNIEFSPEINAQLLLEDPLSVNVLCPTNGVGVIRKQVEDWMQTTDMIKNDQFKMMIRYALIDQTEIDNLLIQGDPYWPRLMHDIHEGTVKGYARSFISKITKTNTTMNVAREQSTYNLIHKLRVAELRYFNSCFFRLMQCLLSGENSLNNAIPVQCSARFADKLRCVGWRKNKILGITTPHPFEAFKWEILYPEGCLSCIIEHNLTHDPDGYILAKISDEFRNNKDLLYERLGPSIPYMGSKTIEKIKKADMNTALNTTPILKRALKLVRTINWFVDPSGHIAGVIRRLVQSLTNLDPSLFETSNSAKTGSEEHRYQDYSTKHGGFNMVKYNVSSYIHLCTTTLTKYAKGSKNVTLHFQATLCYLQSLVGFLFALERDTNSILSVHLHLDCSDCIIPVNTEMIRGHEVMDLIKFPSQKDNPYLWSDVKLISKTYISKNQKYGQVITPNITLYAISLEVFNRVVKNINKTSFLDDSLNSYIPISWACRLPAVPIFENTVVLLYCQYILNTGLSRAFKIYKENKMEFKQWLREIKKSSFLPLSTFFYDEFNRILLSSSQYFIRSPRSTPYTITSVKTSLMDGIMEVVESDLTDIIERVTLYKNLFFVNIVPPLTSLKLLIILDIMSDSHYDFLNYFDVKNILMAIDHFRATTKLESRKNLSVDSFISYLITNINVEENYTPGLIHVFLEWLEDKKLTYYVHSADYLSKNYQGKALREIIHKSEIDTIEMASLAKLDNAAESKFLTRSVLLKESGETPIPPNLDTAKTDFSSHFFRSSVLDTSAHYKLASIINHIYHYIKNPEIAIVGGDGTGGFSLFMMRLFKHLKIYFNSYINLKGTMPQILGDFSPASFDGVASWSDRLITFRDSIEGVTDLTDPKMALQLKTRIGLNLIDFFISDMEGSFLATHDKNFIELISMITKLYDSLSPTFIGITKTYINNPTLVAGVVQHLSYLFEEVRIIRSKFSSFKSSEVYIVFLYKRPNVILDIDFDIFQTTNHDKYLFKVNQELIDQLQDILFDLSTSTVPFKEMYKLSSLYSDVLREKNFYNKSIRHVAHHLRDLCDSENCIQSKYIYSSIFNLSHKTLRPSAFVPLNRKLTKYSVTVSNSSLWQLIKWYAISFALIISSPESLLESITNLLDGWIVGFRTLNLSWGFVIVSSPIFGNVEGFSYTYGFFQRPIKKLRQYSLHIKNIYREISLVNKLYPNRAGIVTPIKTIKLYNISSSDKPLRIIRINHEYLKETGTLVIYMTTRSRPQFDPNIVANSMKQATDIIDDQE